MNKKNKSNNYKLNLSILSMKEQLDKDESILNDRFTKNYEINAQIDTSEMNKSNEKAFYEGVNSFKKFYDYAI